MKTDQLKALRANDDGATLVEYAILICFIAAVCATAVKVLGINVAGYFGPVTSQL